MMRTTRTLIRLRGCVFQGYVLRRFCSCQCENIWHENVYYNNKHNPECRYIFEPGHKFTYKIAYARNVDLDQHENALGPWLPKECPAKTDLNVVERKFHSIS